MRELGAHCCLHTVHTHTTRSLVGIQSTNPIRIDALTIETAQLVLRSTTVPRLAAGRHLASHVLSCLLLIDRHHSPIQDLATSIPQNAQPHMHLLQQTQVCFGSKHSVLG